MLFKEGGEQSSFCRSQDLSSCIFYEIITHFVSFAAGVHVLISIPLVARVAAGNVDAAINLCGLYWYGI